MRVLETGITIDLGDQILIITQVDFQKMEGTFKLCNSRDEADFWLHEASRKQMPEWHQVNCVQCIRRGST